VAPGRLRDLRPTIEAFADDLIDSFAQRGRCEFVAEFATPFPVRVISELLGLPAEDLELLIHFGRGEGAGRVYLPPEQRRAEGRRAAELGAYVEDQLRDRCEHPRNDVLSELLRVQCERDGESNISDLAPDASILLSGGLTTTAHMLTSAMLLVLRHPSELERLTESPELIGRVIEEVLRLESPVQWTPRRVMVDTELNGTHLPKGALLILAYGAGNRDRRAFAQPEEFAPDRRNVKEHLAFGYGPHFCLGAPLARLEGTIALERVLSRLSNIRLADESEEPRHAQNMTLRGLERLEIRFDAT
jgi:cytochrome P450